MGDTGTLRTAAPVKFVHGASLRGTRIGRGAAIHVGDEPRPPGIRPRGLAALRSNPTRSSRRVPRADSTRLDLEATMHRFDFGVGIVPVVALLGALTWGCGDDPPPKTANNPPPPAAAAKKQDTS